VAYDAVTVLGKLLYFRAVAFVLDFLMMCAFALSFFSLLIAYNSGEIRVLYLLFCLSALTLYLLTVHKLVSALFSKLYRGGAHFARFLYKKIKKVKK